MDRNSVKGFITLNKNNYGYLYRDISDVELTALIDNWNMQLECVPDEIGHAAFLLAQRTCGNRPVSIGDMFIALRDMQKQFAPSSENQWQELKAAIRKVGEYKHRKLYPVIVGEDEHGKPVRDNGVKAIEDTFNALPAAVKKFLGSKNALLDLTSQTDGEIDTYKRNEFMKFIKENDNIMLRDVGKLLEFGGEEQRAICNTVQATGL